MILYYCFSHEITHNTLQFFVVVISIYRSIIITGMVYKVSMLLSSPILSLSYKGSSINIRKIRDFKYNNKPC